MSTAILSAAGAVRLPRAGLQDVELAALDGELDVLHLAVVRLEPVEHGGQLGEGLRQHLLHRLRRPSRCPAAMAAGQRLRRADAGHHVLALGVDQELAVDRRVSPVEGLRVKATPVAQSSPMLPNTIAWTVTAVPMSLGDVVQPAVGDRARRLPGAEHGADRAPELLLRVLRERLAGGLRDDRLVAADQLGQGRRRRGRCRSGSRAPAWRPRAPPRTGSGRPPARRRAYIWMKRR